MAQYFHVLSQENPSIQYVISPENQTQLQGQQIVVSTDQLMLIENQGQQVIVDQTGNTYQNAQYIIQEGVPTYSNVRSQMQGPVCFPTSETSNSQSAQVEQQIQQSSPPIVLNHQLHPTRTQSSTDVQKNLTTQARLIQMQQNRAVADKQNTMQQRAALTHVQALPQQLPSTQQQTIRQPPPSLHSTQVQITLAVPNAVVQRPAQQKMLLNRTIPINSPVTHTTVSSSGISQPSNAISTLQFTQSDAQNQDEKSTDDGGEAVCFPNGTCVPLSDYKGMLAGKKKQPTTATVSSTSLIDEMDTMDTIYGKSKTELQKTRIPRGGVRGGRARRGNTRQNSTNSNSSFSQSQPQESADAHQRFMAQQLKIAQQQKTNIPQTQFMQHRQQVLQQQAALRQEQLQQQQLQQQQLPQLQPQQQQYVQPQYIIQPPSMHQRPSKCTLPPNVISKQIKQIIENTPVSDEFPDSIRMLVLLKSGEQRLITFTLPREVCTIHEILEQVGVPFQSNTRIDCQETSYPGINYLVTVGMQPGQYTNLDETIVEVATPQTDETTPTCASEAASSSPELLSETETPRYVSGLVAICTHCGYSSENLNKCLRCKFKLPNEVKTAPVLHNTSENSDGSKDKKIAINLKTPVLDTSKIENAANKKLKPEPDLDIFTLSSDDEEGHNVNNLSETDQLLKRFNNSSVTLSAIRKEPTVNDLQQSMLSDKQLTVAVKGGGKDNDSGPVMALIKCRTIRIGSYKYTPRFDFIVKPLEVILKVPSIKDPVEIKTIVIERKHVAKILVNFQKALPVLFYYVVPSLGESIRSELGMELGSDIYFDPVSNEEAYKRITILPDVVTEEAKLALKEVYGKPPNIVMDELTTKEANDILVKTCPKEISKFVEATMGTRCFSPEVKQLLIYPPGKGGLPINTEDYMCLAQDQFLNDVIIDFYLKYLILQLPQEEQAKIHVFSTFFYKRLTTKPVKASRRAHPAELDPNLTPAQRRHARVEKWTKNVNLFDKDFIIVPINENCHWYLAIICFPALDGCYTLDGKQVQMEDHHKAHKTLTVTITNIKKEKEKPILCEDDELSDKDEAEGDESELDTDVSEESDNPDTAPSERNDVTVPIKQPCILIFDSLAGASRARVVATLRDYLTCEYKAKLGLDKLFTKDVIKGNCPKVPQQTNFTDCGLYLLQYVEHFITHPIQNYRIPIKHLKHWFNEHIVTKKREDIAMLIKDLMVKYNFDTSCVPVLTLPTLNGKPIDNFEDDEEELMNEYEEDEEEEEIADENSSEYLNSSMETHMDMDTHSDVENSYETTPNKIILKEELPSEITLIPKKSSIRRDGGEFLEETVTNESELKPDVSELQKQSSRDTLSYLKAKRIIKHKPSELIDIKKFKTSYD